MARQQSAASHIQTATASDRILHRGEGKLRPRARLIRTIGAELISSEIVAVLELVRNCFDADARRVHIRFEHPHIQQATRLEIVDDGHGMTRDVLLGPWLEPATDHKSSGASDALGGIRSPGGRRRLGAKGVGRFATQRLGCHLTLETSAEQSATMLSATFDWSELDRADRYLDQLRIPWSECTLDDPSWHGTRLVITDLREHWTHERFERLRLALSRLVGPCLGDDTFEIALVINDSVEVIEPALDTTRAMYSLEGEVEAGGVCEITYRDIAGTSEHWTRKVMWPEGESCGPFRFHINAWDLDREGLLAFLAETNSSMGLRDFRRLIRDHSGISLYRDGFRILPYGEPDNDWLRLDRRRVNNPTLRLSNNQILGSLQLGADVNPHLRDQTNREGLVNNEAYRHLQTVVLEILSYLESRRFAARRSLGLGQGQTITALPEYKSHAGEQVDALLGELRDTGLEGEQAVLEELEAHIDQQREQMTNTIREYAGLASAGQMARLVFRQVRHPLRQLEGELSLLRDELTLMVNDPDDLADVQVVLDKMTRLVGDMQTRMTRLDPLTSTRRGRRKIWTDLVTCCSDVIKSFEEVAAAHEVQFALRCKQDALQVQTDPSLIQQALALLIENAIQWSAAGNGSPRQIQVEPDEEGIWVRNNGPAISPEIRDLIFDAHFSTRPDAGGMGLTLARDLMKTLGGSVHFRHRFLKWVTFRVNFQGL